VDIDLPLILMIAVAVMGAIWLFDWLFLAKRRQEGAREPWPVEYSKSLFPVVFLVFFLRSFVVEPFQIPSGSMIPTLQVGDFIAVNKFAYGIKAPVFRKTLIPVGKPERGDVVVFFPPNETRYFIKRLIGLPGDQITYINHQLFVNGAPTEYKALTEGELAAIPFHEANQVCSYQGDTYQVVYEKLGVDWHRMQKCPLPSYLSAKGSWTVPAGEYFMMGDNRDNSKDSRVWGSVPEENLVGKAFAVWMYFPSISALPSFERNGAIE
jgi:signal peptidase I